mgnify:CR=1 FL=1
MKKPLVVIPARGGSKGLVNKNKKLLNGMPLILYTVNAARKVFPDSQIVVSTDDAEIKEIVESSGLPVPFLRPEELATDTMGVHDVLLHAINYSESKGYVPDTIVLMQPTSPFRTSTHILGAIDLFDKNTEMVVSVKEAKSNPYFVLREENEKGWLEKFKEEIFDRRQDCPTVYELNGAIYLIQVDALKRKGISKLSKVRKYMMSSVCSQDIDTIEDWLICEMILEKGLLLNEDN